MNRARRINLIAAVADNGVIGNAGALPWHLPADLKHFKQLTVGKPVVMGRKTYESIGKPLPGRHNIIITRQRDFVAAGCTVVHSLAEALTAADPAPDVMVIGGAELYAQTLLLADRLLLTEVHVDAAGDTLFPTFSKGDWRQTSRVQHPPEAGRPGYSFVVFERVPPSD